MFWGVCTHLFLLGFFGFNSVGQYAHTSTRSQEARRGHWSPCLWLACGCEPSNVGVCNCELIFMPTWQKLKSLEKREAPLRKCLPKIRQWVSL